MGNELQATGAVEAAFSGHEAYYRDTVLPARLLPLYEVGVVFRDPTLCDATHQFGGFAAPHRYLIISTSATCLDSLSQEPGLGQCIWLPGRLFKVIAVHQRDGHSQVTLLEIPEALRAQFATAHLTPMEEQFAEQAAAQFEQALRTPALPEHASPRWLDRLAYPLGIDDHGRFFECWHPVGRVPER